MPVCIIKGCATTSKTKPYDIMLHSFPKEKEMIIQWLQQMQQDFGDLEEFAEKVFTSSRGNYRMCSLHFTRNAYEKRGYTVFLKKDAIPTVFPDPTANQASAKKSSATLSSEHNMAPQIKVKIEDETSSHDLFDTEARVPVMPYAVLPNKQEMVAGHEPFEPCLHIKTEGKTSEWHTSHAPQYLSKQDIWVQSNVAVPLHTHIKTEDGTSSLSASELHRAHSVAPTGFALPEKEEETGIPLNIHIKTEDETSGGFITTEIKTVHIMPSANEPEGSTPRPQKRKKLFSPRSIKTVGTVTRYFPGQVHKSIQFDRSMGAKHRSYQVRLRPHHNSIGIQCNLVRLPSLKTIAPRQTESTT